MFSFRSSFIAMILGLTALTSFAQTVPSTINYQGRLTDNSPTPVPISATVGMRFEIWDDPAAGTMLWQEPNPLLTPSVPVVVTNGIFNVLLGGNGVALPATVFSGGTARYLQIIAGGETLTPRQVISATGYANQAENAALAANATLADSATNSTQLGGVPASGYQLATVQSCAGQSFVKTIANGTATCALPQANNLTAPVTLGGSLAFPTAVLSASNNSSGPGISASSTSGIGISVTAGGTDAINATATATDGNGVHGIANNGSGAYAVWGQSSSGYGVRGSGAIYGVAGIGIGTGTGVFGGSGVAGSYGGSFTNSGGGTALFSSGMLEVVSATNNTGNNTARFSASGLTDPKFDSHIHYGMNGDWYIRSAHAAGIVVLQDTGGQVSIGSASPSFLNTALMVQSGFPIGIVATNATAGGTGITGRAIAGSGSGGTGVSGVSGDGGRGVFGSCSGGGCYAGYFFGNVNVTGTLSKSAGSFKIDHPLDPENRYLYHSFVESPDMKNIYDGVITTDGRGEAVVTMPDWFEALNRDFRYQLTVIGEFAQAIVGREIQGGSFIIKTNKPGVKVSWQVTGIRKDPYAEKHRIPVEQDKPANERGFYLHPGDYGQPEEKGVERGTHPELMERMKEEREKSKAPAESPAAPVP